MAKKKVKKGKTCSSSCCSASCWFWIVVSEAALYLFFVYLLYLLAIPANLWGSSAILLVLINISFFACPYMRKHFRWFFLFIFYYPLKSVSFFGILKKLFMLFYYLQNFFNSFFSLNSIQREVCSYAF